MIFKPELAHKILAGQKTQTRRLVQDPRPATRKNGTAYLTTPFRPRVEQDLAIQKGRGKEAIGRITVTDVRREPVGEITHDDAQAEGFRNVEAFKAYWVRLHDPNWPPLIRVFCPTCTDPDYPADELPPCPMCDGDELIKIKPVPTVGELVARFDAHHHHRPVWVITFNLNRAEEPRLLMSASRGPVVSPTDLKRESRDDDLGYTRTPSRAMDPLEVADPDALQIHWEHDAAQRHADARGEQQRRQRARSLARRVRQAALHADDEKLDALEQQVQAIEGEAA